MLSPHTHMYTDISSSLDIDIWNCFYFFFTSGKKSQMKVMVDKQKKNVFNEFYLRMEISSLFLYRLKKVSQTL